MNGSDRATLALINHAVKEASDSLQIKQLVRLSAGDSTASRALMDHARKMDAGSRQTIESLAPADENGRRVGSTFSGRGGPGGITLLAQEARQVLDAIRELDSLDGRPAGGRPAVSPSPGTVDPSTTPAASGDVRPPR
ncbi:MAG: hypothetical protein U0835_11250 [Isosphaeraceae bacterium]